MTRRLKEVLFPEGPLLAVVQKLRTIYVVGVHAVLATCVTVMASHIDTLPQWFAEVKADDGGFIVLIVVLAPTLGLTGVIDALRYRRKSARDDTSSTPE